MERYSIIHEKNPREIVLLRGTGCVWKRCPFCDYHTDACPDERENCRLNEDVLAHVTGQFGDLEVINSGSVFELDGGTMDAIARVCAERHIHTLHFESHYLYRDRIPALRASFPGIRLRMKLGLETFDFAFREQVLRKGIPDEEPAVIAQQFDEANLLFGLTGQTVQTMRRDIELGLRYFDRICVNIMCENTTPVRPDRAVIAAFCRELYPVYRDNARVDILMQNTDFGVGD